LLSGARLYALPLELKLGGFALPRGHAPVTTATLPESFKSSLYPLARRLFRPSRRSLQYFLQGMLPEFRLAGGAVAGSLVAGGYQEHAAIFHAFDLALQQPELRWIAFVVRSVDPNTTAWMHSRPGDAL
jgi:hypothetical protein